MFAVFSNVTFVVSSATVVCPAGFTYVHGGCYQVTASSSLSWPAAETACEGQSAYLAVPSSESEARWVFEMFVVLGQISLTENAWLGISDISEEGVWRAVSDDDSATPAAPLAFTYWASNQPGVANSNENCVTMSPFLNAVWSHLACRTAARGLCKYDATVTPLVQGWLVDYLLFVSPF